MQSECPSCRGYGGYEEYVCATCNATGHIEALHPDPYEYILQTYCDTDRKELSDDEHVLRTWVLAKIRGRGI